MRDIFIKTVMELAEKNPEIVLLTGDLGFGVLKPYWEKLPDQFVNAGIAEQNMTALAAGLSKEGKIVFTYSIGNFPTLRCLEQIRNDCAYHQANVKIVCVGGGFSYGPLGMSHQATEDIAVLRALPGVTVLCPGDPLEAAEAAKAAVACPGTCYVRLGRGGEKQVHKEIADFRIGRAIRIRKCPEEKKIALFSTGAILEEADAAAEMLERRKIGVEAYSFPTVKPIDGELIRNCADQFDFLVTVEEHNLSGGFGSAVSEVLSEYKGKSRLIRIGLHDTYGTIVGDQNYLREQYGLSRKKIADAILCKIREFANKDV